MLISVIAILLVSFYYDYEDYVSDVPKVDHDAESLYSEEFDWNNFACNLEEAGQEDLHVLLILIFVTTIAKIIYFITLLLL